MSRLFLFLFVIAEICCAQVERYALVIGQNNGGASVNQLRFAERDAQRIADVLRNLGDFRAENTTVLLGPDSTKIAEHLEKLAKKIISHGNQNRALFFLYYSGHADISDLLLNETRFSLEKLQGLISNFPAAFRIAIFDACQSGVVAAYKGGKRSDPFYLQSNQSPIKGQVIIASASAQERAQESPMLKGSVFTYHLINGLNGSADISSDNKVTLNEAYQYAYRKTIETSALATGEIQHPVFRFNILGQGEIVLTNLEKSESGILLGMNSEGKFLVLSEDYLDVYADLFKSKNSELFIALRQGKYTIVNAVGRDVGTLIVQLKRKKILKIEQGMFIPNTLTESRIKGGVASDGSGVVNAGVPFSRNYRWGIGGGFFLGKKEGSDDWNRDLDLFLTNNLQLKPNFALSSDLYGILLNKTGGIFLGADFRKNNGFADIFAGIGAGGEYNFNEHKSKADAFSPFMRLYGGFTTNVSNNTKMQIRLPGTMLFDENVKYRIGVDLSFLFKVR